MPAIAAAPRSRTQVGRERRGWLEPLRRSPHAGHAVHSCCPLLHGRPLGVLGEKTRDLLTYLRCERSRVG